MPNNLLAAYNQDEISKPASSSSSTLCGSENELTGSSKQRSNGFIIESEKLSIIEPFKGLSTNPERLKLFATQAEPKAEPKP